MAAQQGKQGLDLNTLTAQQLMRVKKQLDEELEHLNGSFNQLRGAQGRFSDSVRSLERGVAGGKKGTPILVPLTTSLYVPGKLADTSKVLVDVGTGFYVEKSVPDAKSFYDEKTKDIGKNLKDLEGILQGKSNNLRMVEEVLRMKVMQGENPGPEAGGGAVQPGA